VLVVFSPHVIIISVKDIQLHDVDDRIACHRWERRAIEASVKQIYGAERWLDWADQIIRSDGSLGPLLPPKEHRRLHRIAVAFGGRGAVPLHTSNNSAASYFQKLWTVTTSQAAFRSPSTYAMPSIRSCSFSLPFSFRQVDWAFSASLNAIARPATREPGPLVR
jgi:hypothetical protein